MADPLLQFEHVSFRSEGGRLVLEAADWTLARGAKVDLRAASSHNVAALFRLAAGLAVPQAGQVLLDGIPLGPHTFDHPFLGRGALGWVPREGGLLANQSLLQNIALPLMFTKGMDRASAEALADRTLEEAGLGHMAAHRPHALDPGERWLGALVRAAAMDPELWLVDHPPAGLSRADQAAAAAVLGRAAASPASMAIAALAAWIPGARLQAIGLDNGSLVPEEA
ncbi:MAG TPA: ATP-binding cassette domain-containing protein [Holophaga sp.]|nr:ATP-binding cassette domain-containing protein [Holophaga sp.]